MRFACGLVLGVTAAVLVRVLAVPYLRWQFSRGD
jgi:hypothetical protein